MNHIRVTELKNNVSAVQEKAQAGDPTAILNFKTVTAVIMSPDWYQWFDDVEIQKLMEKRREVNNGLTDVQIIKQALQMACLLDELPKIARDVADIKKALNVL